MKRIGLYFGINVPPEEKDLALIVRLREIVLEDFVMQYCQHLWKQRLNLLMVY